MSLFQWTTITALREYTIETGGRLVGTLSFQPPGLYVGSYENQVWHIDSGVHFYQERPNDNLVPRGGTYEDRQSITFNNGPSFYWQEKKQFLPLFRTFDLFSDTSDRIMEVGHRELEVMHAEDAEVLPVLLFFGVLFYSRELHHPTAG